MKFIIKKSYKYNNKRGNKLASERASEQANRKDNMALTIKQLDKKMNDIESYYNQFNMCSYEYPLKDKMYLGRLYKLKLKQQANKQKG